MRGIVGIDFGTTNTLCSWMDGETPVIVPNARGERATPSVVALSGAGELLVGSSARNQALVDPDTAIFGVKRVLGRHDHRWMPGVTASAEDAAAAILDRVRRDASRFLGFDISSAVITVPARFGDPQRRAVREAARRAGLRTERIINEPSAAALARAWSAVRDDTETTVLVYDFGGGTFDATVLRARGGSCRVLASEGDDRLGGMDIDAALYEYATGRFRDEYSIATDDDPFLAGQVMDLCEKAKKELSVSQEATVAIPFMQLRGQVIHPSIRIDRPVFDALSAPFIERTLDLVRRVMTVARVQPESIGAVVLSGGSSRIPLARSSIARMLGREPDPRINPEEIVALGAAVEAARIEGRLSGLSFTDVCSRTFGLEIEGGRFVPLIHKNEALPATGRRVFTTVEDYQQSVELHVLQADELNEGHTVSVSRFLLPGIRRALQGEPSIGVEFAIDEGDMLMVRARDNDTGSEQTIVVFDGSMDQRSPRDRVLALMLRARREASSLVLDSALTRELADTIALAEASLDDDEKAGMAAMLLEGIIAELAALSSRAGSSGDLYRGDLKPDAAGHGVKEAR